MNNYLTYESKYDRYEDCYFQTGRYLNGNLVVEIYSRSLGPITRVTINPDIVLPDDLIAIKNYSENSGMVEWLISQGIIEPTAIREITSGWVSIPVHRLTEKGKQILGI